MTYPLCVKCGKHPHSHALLGPTLACVWEGKKVITKGDFGPDTIEVVASVYSDIGRKLPVSVYTELSTHRKREKTLGETS